MEDIILHYGETSKKDRSIQMDVIKNALERSPDCWATQALMSQTISWAAQPVVFPRPGSAAQMNGKMGTEARNVCLC